jgi:hypothetical protein
MLPLSLSSVAMIDRRSRKRENYRPAARLFRACRVGGWIAGALLLGGCSMALPSLIDDEPVGSIKPAASTLSKDYDPRDWRIAEPVLASSLRAPDPAEPAVWSDAETGARGEFLAVAAPFSRGGQSCRKFVARLIDGKAARRLQAVGCPSESGEVAIFDASRWTQL